MARRNSHTRIWTGYCPQCLAVHAAAPGDVCPKCQVAYIGVLDDKGALSREYLLARKVCCKNFCCNCPYDFKPEFEDEFKGRVCQ